MIDLSLVRCTDLRLARLTDHAALGSLHIAECPILDVEELASFQSLRSLTIEDCYTFEATRFLSPEELPALTSLRINGVRAAASVIRKRWRDHPWPVRHARTQPPVVAQAPGQPVSRLGPTTACPTPGAAATAWGKAVATLTKIAPDDLAGATHVLHEFVAQFNRFDDRQVLDTTQVEDVAEAYDQLTTLHAALQEHPDITDRFDEWRTF